MLYILWFCALLAMHHNHWLMIDMDIIILLGYLGHWSQLTSLLADFTSFFVPVVNNWIYLASTSLFQRLQCKIYHDWLLLVVVVFMDARSASVHVIFCWCFLLYFFIPALVGQTAERIFTKLSHVVDIRHHLWTY